MKFRILFIVLTAIVALGLRDPQPGSKDPVPGELIVAHSIHCAGCHGYDPTGVALTTEAGEDVSMYDDWRVSMMGLSAWDPFWRATLQHEVDLFPAAQSAIEQKCLKCHAPLGSHQRAYDGLGYSYAEMLQDSLGLDGVSCVACHQQPPSTFGNSHSGNIVLNTEREIYGPHPDPFEGPMELYVGFTPVFTDLMYSSGVCAGCHTLVTETLDENGLPTGDVFVEQATYHEWINSTYAFQGIECQDCHMPLLEDSIILAIELKDLQKRSPYGLHQFRGANTAMLMMMREHKDALGLPVASPERAWDESIENNRSSLRSAATVHLDHYDVAADTLYAHVHIVNKTGHKLPSGYPSRIAWLQVLLLDDVSGDTIYYNGEIDAEGNIAGRDLPYETHHSVSKSEDDVQIYEMVMSDKNGALTTRLNAAYRPLKDNRLLPLGFRVDHPMYDTVAIWGSAVSDPEYSVESTAGIDRIEYRIPLNGREGLADLQIALRYHTFPVRWMHDLFENDDIAEVAVFKGMYAGYETFTELIDSIGVEDLILESSAAGSLNSVTVIVSPNPTSARRLYIQSDEKEFTQFEIRDLNGRLVQSGPFEYQISLPHSLLPSTYLLVLTDHNGGQYVSRIVLL